MCDDLKIASLDRLCRTCLSEKNVDELRSLYENSLEHQLSEITSTKLDINEGLPSSMCNDCYFSLNIAINFKTQCKRSESQLKSWFSNSQAIIYRSIAILSDNQGEIHIRNFEEINVKNASTHNEATVSESMAENTHTPFTNLDSDKDESETHDSELGSGEYHQVDITNEGSSESTSNLSLTLANSAVSLDTNKCTECGEYFESEMALNSHVKHCKSVSCAICGAKLDKKQDFKSHMLNNHPNHYLHSCKECGKGFSLSTSLKKHMRTHGGDKKHLCTVCGKRFYEQNHLSIHNRIHTGEKPVICTLCGKKFSSTHGLLVHTKTHTGERNYECDVCGKRFAHSSVLKTHKRTHTGEKPYACTECGASFKTSSYLRIHSRTHTQEKPYSCQICPKSFVSRCALSAHQITHTGEKKFECKVCGKMTGRSADLQIHMRSHTGEKPYACDQCPKRYHTSSNLATHKRTHSGIRDHVCDTCGKAFGDSRTLKSHYRTHTGEKPFVCVICGSRYTQSGQLAVHRKIHQQPKCN